MKSRRFILAFAFALSLTLVFLFVLMKSGTAQTDVQNAFFKAKIAVVGVSNRSIPLEGAEVRKIGDRYFLVGKAVDDRPPANLVKDHTMWLPMNDVASIVEVASVEEMKKAWAEYLKITPTTPFPASLQGERPMP